MRQQDQESGKVITFLSDTQFDPVNDVQEYDPWLDQPDQQNQIFLPVMQK